MRFRNALFVVLIFILGHLSAYWLVDRDGSASPTPALFDDPAVALAQPAPARLPAAELTTQEERDIAIFRNVSPSVVYISNIDLRRDFFSLNVFAIPRGYRQRFCLGQPRPCGHQLPRHLPGRPPESPPR